MTRRSPGYEFLIELYLRYRTTVDRLASQPERLAALTAELNARGFNYTSGEIMQRLMNDRKARHLPPLNEPAAA